VKISKLVVALTATLLTLTVASAGVATARVVSQNSSSGAYAVTATGATINHPHRIAVRFSGGSGYVVWACDKGYSIGSWSRHYGRGVHWLPYVGGKDSCDVTASVGGSGRVGVQILT
jgi:hypothetical protein